MRSTGTAPTVRRFTVARLVAAAGVALSAAAPARAGIVGGDSYWITLPTTAGNWTDNVNWNPIAPTTARNAFIQSGIGATANLGPTAAAKTLFVNGDATLRSGTLALDSSAGNLWMNEGAGTTLTLAASTSLGNVRLTTPTATVGASDTANGVDVGGYLETNVVNLDTSGTGTSTLAVAGDLNIGNDGSGNAVQGSPNGTSGSSAAIISAGSIKVSIAATAGAADYNWIGTYGANDTLAATNLQIGYAGDKGGAENQAGSWTVTNTIIGDQASSNDNYVSVSLGGTITNNGQMVLGLGGSNNRLLIEGASFDMSASTNDLVIGSLAGATGNGIGMDGGSLVVGERIVVGDAGASNFVELYDGSSVTSAGIDVGRNSAGNVFVLQRNSTTTVNGTVRVGDNGSNNRFLIRRGNVVTLAQPDKDFTIGYGSYTASNDNTLEISGVGSKLVMHQANSALWVSGVAGVGGGTGNMALVRDGGTLEVDMVIVAPGGTLAGNSSVVGTVNVATGGVIAPGDGTAGSLGTLSVTGDADFSPLVGGPGLLEIDIDGLLCDMLSVSGALDLSGATLDLNFIGPPSGMAYLIADYGTLTGTFGSVVDLPAGWYVDYTFGGMNKIAVVPEPSAIVLAGLGLAGIAAWRLRRKRPA